MAKQWGVQCGISYTYGLYHPTAQHYRYLCSRSKAFLIFGVMLAVKAARGR
jgi:hypothetical protein